MQTISVAGRPALVRAASRNPSLLNAALMVSVGISLSTLSSAGWAQAASADAATLPAVTVTASRDDAATQTDKIDGGALGSRKQVDTPFSTHVVSSEEGAGPDGADRQRPLQVRPGGSRTSAAIRSAKTPCSPCAACRSIR